MDLQHEQTHKSSWVLLGLRALPLLVLMDSSSNQCKTVLLTVQCTDWQHCLFTTNYLQYCTVWYWLTIGIVHCNCCIISSLIKQFKSCTRAILCGCILPYRMV